MRLAILLILSSSTLWGQMSSLLMSNATPMVATPTDSPGAGTYTGTQSVTLACATTGCVICYRTDNTAPTATTAGTCDSPAITYSGAFNISTTSTLKAIGTKVGDLNSGVLTSAYTINAGSITPIGAADICNGGSGSVNTTAVDVTGANFLVANIGGTTGSGWTVVDNCGTVVSGACAGTSNTWSPLTATGGSPQAQLWYAQNPNVGTGFILSLTNGTFNAACLKAYAGMKTTGVSEGTNSAQNPINTNSSNQIQAGSTTPTGTGQQLVCAGLSNFDVGGTPTIDSSFPAPLFITAAGGVNYASAISCLVVNSNTAVNPKYTSTGSSSMAATNAVFQGQ